MGGERARHVRPDEAQHDTDEHAPHALVPSPGEQHQHADGDRHDQEAPVDPGEQPTGRSGALEVGADRDDIHGDDRHKHEQLDAAPVGGDHQRL